MNKKLSILSAILLALALQTGCKGEVTVQKDGAEPETFSFGTETSTKSTPAGDASTSVFQEGAWQGENMYYFFTKDGSSGSTSSMEDGTGTSFTYDINGNEVIFHMGSVDDSTVATMVQSGESEVELKWADGQTEKLEHVSNMGADIFEFYTNEELCDLAVSNYYAENGGDPASNPVTATATTQPDGEVFIQISSDEGDHLSNLAQYNVNRRTASGTDAMTERTINLNFYGFDGLYKNAVDWFNSQTNEYEVLDGEVCGESGGNVVLLTTIRDPVTGNYKFLQVFVLEPRSEGYEVTAWRDAQYGDPAGFTANVLSTDELTVVFGDADNWPFTQAKVIFDDGLFETRPIGGYQPYVIIFEGKKNVTDIAFDVDGSEVKYSDYFGENLMDDSASADIIPLN